MQAALHAGQRCVKVSGSPGISALVMSDYFKPGALVSTVAASYLSDRSDVVMMLRGKR